MCYIKILFKGMHEPGGMRLTGTGRVDTGGREGNITMPPLPHLQTHLPKGLSSPQEVFAL